MEPPHITDRGLHGISTVVRTVVAIHFTLSASRKPKPPLSPNNASCCHCRCRCRCRCRCYYCRRSQVLNGIRTELVVIPYADRTFVIVTQLKKLGNLVSVDQPQPLFSAPEMNVPAVLQLCLTIQSIPTDTS